jgi:hypothetical protein
MSINQLIATALAEKMEALLTEESRTRKGTNRAKFVAVLARFQTLSPRITIN